jgi:hypothetical protein
VSGVRTGSRLEQLEALRRRTAVQHEHARRSGHPHAELGKLLARLDDEIRTEGGTPPPAPQPAPRRQPPVRGLKGAEEYAAALMAHYGVAAVDVKRWAVSAGLLDQVRRGRVALELVEAYAAHHPTTPERNTP